MKREIKFRCWDRNNKIFRYPKLFWDSVMPSNWEKYYDISQYTGLKDKNGVEIYEGDMVVLLGLENKPRRVMFFACRWVFERKDLVIDIEPSRFMEYEVVGNIYQNIKDVADKTTLKD